MKATFFALALAASAYAHFELGYPEPRGDDHDLQTQFCGGYNATTRRTPFPLGSAPITLESGHGNADIAIFVSFDQNPTNYNQFNTTAAGASYGPLKPYGTLADGGDFCFNVDVSSLGVAGVQNGSLATIQVLYNGGDGLLSSCADVVLIQNYTPPNVTCANSTSTHDHGDDDDDHTHAGSTPAQTSTGTAPAGSQTTTPGGSAAGLEVKLGVAAAVLLGAMSLVL